MSFTYANACNSLNQTAMDICKYSKDNYGFIFTEKLLGGIKYYEKKCKSHKEVWECLKSDIEVCYKYTSPRENFYEITIFFYKYVEVLDGKIERKC